MTPTPETFTRHLIWREMKRTAKEALTTLALCTWGLAIVTVEGWWRNYSGILKSWRGR